MEQSVRNSRRGQRGPTIADVAKLAGVSPMTVSRVVNGGASVLTFTREKVEAAIRELRYVPNIAARRLAGGRQLRIALLYANPSASYLSELLVGSLAEASSCDAQLLVEHCAGNEAPTALVARLIAHRIDAVLLPPPLCDDSGWLAALARAGMAMAQIATGVPSPLAHAVTIHDEGAAQVLTERLIAAGHRRIGFVAGATNQTVSALRRAGYEAALRGAGIVPDPELIEQGDFTYRSGFAAATRLLARVPRPTAIFASNDDMAAAVMSVAHRLGLDVPGDVSVCGFDDTAIATTTWPELTTVRQPVADMARTAIRLLAEVVGKDAGRRVMRHERLNYTIMERGSDGSPAGA